MPVTVKTISLWRREVENQVGALAKTLEPLTKAGANLQVLMGYRYPGEGTKAAIELYPIESKKATAAAAEAGLVASSIPTLLVDGDDKPGLGLAIAEAISAARINMSFINMSFFVAQAIGRKFSAVLGFETEADAKTAAPLRRRSVSRHSAELAYRSRHSGLHVEPMDLCPSFSVPDTRSAETDPSDERQPSESAKFICTNS